MATTAPPKTMKRRKPRIDVRAAVRSWLLNDDAVKKFTTAKEEGRKLLLGILQDEGTKDESGHYWLRFPEDPVEGRVKAIKAERRVSRVLDPEAAEEFLKSRKLYSQCIKTITVLDEDVILGLNFDGKITDEELESIYAVSESFAFVPQRVKL